jgi:hypothetical protein
VCAGLPNVACTRLGVRFGRPRLGVQIGEIPQLRRVRLLLEPWTQLSCVCDKSCRRRNDWIQGVRGEANCRQAPCICVTGELHCVQPPIASHHATGAQRWACELMQASCATKIAPEVHADDASAKGLPNSECSRQGSTRCVMKSAASAILASPFLQQNSEQATVISASSVEILVDGCCPRVGPIVAHTVRHPPSLQHRRSLSVYYRLRYDLLAARALAKEVGTPSRSEADGDDRVSSDAHSVACLLMKRCARPHHGGRTRPNLKHRHQ